MKKLTTIVALTVLTAGTLSAAGRTGNSFAIVVDAASYAKCTASIDDYCRSVRSDGLDAFISARDWKTPEQVKDSLLKWYDERSLEGALKSMLGIATKVHLMPPKSIQRSEGKAVRVIDKRKLID